MNLIKKFPTNSLIEVSSQIVSFDDKNRTKEPPIIVGTKKVQEIKIGWHAKNESGNYSKITAINTSEGAVKKVTLSSGNAFFIDALSNVEIGETFSEFEGLLTSEVISVSEESSATLYEFVLDGEGGLLINNVAIN